ncbi:MAG: hypothetical protein AAF682_15195 [Planctomycetota bacterium]
MRTALVAKSVALSFVALGSAHAQGGAIDGDPIVLTLDALPPGAPVTVIDGSFLGVDGSPALGASGQADQPGPADCGAATTDFLLSGAPAEGDVPTAAAFSIDGTRLYVAHRGSRDLTVFDAVTRDWLNTIPLSGSPNDVAVTADGLYAVTANIWDDTVSIVDLATETETVVVPVGDQPSIVRTSPTGATAVVGNAVDQDLSILDVAAGSETFRVGDLGLVSRTTISFEPGQVTTIFSDLAFLTPTVVVQADFWNDQIELIDVTTGAVTTLPCDADPRGVAASAAAGVAVVTHTGSTRRISVVDGTTMSISKTIPTGIDLNGQVAMRPDGGRVACAVSNAVVIVDLTADSVSSTIDTASLSVLRDTGDGVHALCIGFQGSLVSYATESEVKELGNVGTPYGGAHSPAGPRAVMLLNHQAEDLLFVNTNGAAGFQEGRVSSGPLPEADKSRRAAISADGTRAVTTDNLSDTATVFDLTTGLPLGTVEVGDRPSGVAITPDGALAVVANLDSSFVSVIDLATLSVTNVPTSTRNSEVAISPDGAFAYVSVVSSDGVWRIDLGSLTASGFVSTGQMGTVFFLYQQNSGIALSNDGATLVTCNSGDDSLSVIDTTTMSLLASVLVGDNPVQAAFSADDSTIYVTNKNAGTVSLVSNAGVASVQTSTIAVGTQPYEVVVSADGARLFVGCTGTDTVDVVELGLGAVITSIPVPDNPQGMRLSESGGCLRVASGTWSVALGPQGKIQLNADGALSTIDTTSLAITDQVLTGEPGGGLALDDCDSIGVIPAPFVGDGIVRARFGPLASTSPYGCGLNPAGSLTVVSGAPIPGGELVLGVANPLGTQPAGSLPFVALATSPDPAFPCGTPIPGFGMASPGASGELLLSLTPAPFATVPGPAWGGVGTSAPVSIPLPPQCALLGDTVYAQGILLDVTFALGGPLAFTEGRELSIGR